MKIIYSEKYNFELGLLKYLHPFDRIKFRRIYNALKHEQDVEFIYPDSSMSMDMADEFLSSVMIKRVRNKNGIFRAIEVPKIPFITFKYLDRKILQPMRWGVAGTMLAARGALGSGELHWNLSGGYHHASPQNMEGFCIYNDIGICYQQFLKQGLLSPEDKILIIDTDAHHGNGNAYTFLENEKITILDIYNAGIYPMSGHSRARVNISVPLVPGTEGGNYLAQYEAALKQIDDDFRLAFVVAGTDVLASDALGGLCLTVDDIVEREKMTIEVFKQRNIPAVILGGGGYSKESAVGVVDAIMACANL